MAEVDRRMALGFVCIVFTVFMRRAAVCNPAATRVAMIQAAIPSRAILVPSRAASTYFHKCAYFC